MTRSETNPDETPDIKKPDEIFSEMDSYQNKLSSDWETAKASYQSKINQILEEFIKEKSNAPDGGFSILMPEDEKKGKKSKLDNLMNKAERALKSAEDKVRMLSYKPQNPSVVNIDWGQISDHRNRRWPKILMGFAVCGFLYWGISYFLHPGAATPLPYNHTTSLAVANHKIYVADWFRKTLYVHGNRHGLPLQSIETIPNDFINGLALTPNQVWTVNSLKSEFIEHDLSTEHSVVNHVAAPGPAAVGLYFDGTDVWSMDDQEKSLYRFRGTDVSEVKETYRFDTISPVAFAIHQGRVWVLVKKSRQLNVYRLEDPLRLLNRYDLDPLLKGANVTGLAFDGNHVLLLTDSPSQVLRLSRRQISRYTEEPRS